VVRAVRELSEAMELARLSSWYWSAPFEAPSQPDFLNAVAAFETNLAPEALLGLCNRVEHSQGRIRDLFRGPRTLDLDILLYADLVHESPTLTIPHVELHRRRFVLAPLCEIAPEIVHPSLGWCVRELYGRCPDPGPVRRVHGSAEWAQLKAAARAPTNKVEPVV